MEIDAHCPHCKQRFQALVTSQEAPCPHCQKSVVGFPTDRFQDSQGIDQCVVCGCADVYRHRDFNRALGIGLVVIGVVLAYFTYGISLLLVTVIDWWLYRRVGEVVSCYRCGGVYRDVPNIEETPLFNLSLHDYYRSLKAGEAVPRPSGEH